MTNTLTKPESKTVPARAMTFDAGVFEFGDADDKGTSAPIKMVGRSAQPINHWYWGKIVHDMSGFSTDHEKVPIDWSHDSYTDEGIGYLDKFTADPKKGLLVEGRLVSIEDGDRASKLMKKASAGVPYQASIFFRAEKLEQVPEGFTTTVNGFTLEGPAIIVRQWALRGMAVCLYGADHRTQSKFSDGDQVAVELFTLEPEMSKGKSTETPAADPAKLNDTKPETPAADPAKLTDTKPETPAADPAKLTDTKPADSSRDELKKFVAAFGAEHGANWFADGVSFADAQAKHIEVLANQLKAKDEEISKLSDKIKSVDRGERSPVGFTDAEQPGTDPAKNSKFAHLGSNLSKFADAVKLPSAPAEK